MRKIGFVALLIFGLILSIWPVSVEAKTVYTISGDETAVAEDDWAEGKETTGIECRNMPVKKPPVDEQKPWIANGQKYLPFIDEYLAATNYAAWLTNLKSEGFYSDDKVGKLSTDGLRLTARKTKQKVILSLTNLSDEDQTEVRFYAFQDGNVLRLFIDTEDGTVAYTSLKISSNKRIRSAEIKTESIGDEDLNVESLTSTDGERIGADLSGEVTAGETVKVILTLK